MKDRRFNEKELLENLDSKGAHADELARPLPQEVEPLERLRGSVKKYERPLDGCWEGDIDPEEEMRCADVKSGSSGKGQK
ncbi:hypothetical protein [Marinobacter sp. M5B]|uniref:hypothetical protein n=1 Tax=Marinobacter sp. M5B TaxID=3141535 RepID=UPI0036D241DB